MPGKTYSEQLQVIVEWHRQAGEAWPTSMRHVAAWAIRERLWSPQRSTIIDRCAKDLARAMREEYITDPQGRTIRSKHAARYHIGDGEQIVLWDDIRTAPRMHMEVAFQQRRQQIVGGCRQLKADVDSYNENANTGELIQMVFDFTYDLIELECPSSVPSAHESTSVQSLSVPQRSTSWP